MLRVGVVGVPSTGKTSLARALSGYAIKYFNSIELISEAAREYIAQYGSIETIADEYLILESQIEQENRFPKVDLMITDSPLHLLLVYSQQLKRIDNVKDSLIMERIFKKINDLGQRYDVIFYLPPIIEPVNDGVRPLLHLDKKWRENTDRLIKSTFDVFPPKKFVEVKPIEMKLRVEVCMGVLKDL